MDFEIAVSVITLLQVLNVHTYMLISPCCVTIKSFDPRFDHFNRHVTLCVRYLYLKVIHVVIAYKFNQNIVTPNCKYVLLRQILRKWLFLILGVILKMPQF